jgi:hypothetical protein
MKDKLWASTCSEDMFEREEGEARVKSWIREGISWHLGDANASELTRVLGPQDMVVANSFLCHMEQPVAKIVCGTSRAW